MLWVGEDLPPWTTPPWDQAAWAERGGSSLAPDEAGPCQRLIVTAHGLPRPDCTQRLPVWGPGSVEV